MCDGELYFVNSSFVARACCRLEITSETLHNNILHSGHYVCGFDAGRAALLFTHPQNQRLVIALSSLSGKLFSLVTWGMWVVGYVKTPKKRAKTPGGPIPKTLEKSYENSRKTFFERFCENAQKKLRKRSKKVQNQKRPKKVTKTLKKS